MRNIGQSFGAPALAILCVLLIGSLQVPQLNQLSDQSKNASPEKIRQEVEAEKLYLNLVHKLPTLGLDNLVADWIFLKFLQYFGDDTAREQTDYSLSSEYFETIIDRDPRFLDAYFFLSGSTSLYAGQPERSVALMRKGLESLSPKVPPKSYYVWRYKAVDELLFLGDGGAARRSFEMAALWASEYSDPESQYVANASRRTADFLARNPDSKSAQVGAWTIILTNALDDRTRKIAIERIKALGGDVVITPQGQVQIRMPAED